MTLGNVKPVTIEEQMRSSYLDYAMSVIVSRALPDVRDGLKPVQRRILFAMNDMGITASSPHKKSARIVGDVLGKYHPHGDAPVYEAMVRMAQDFSMRYVLIDGQGNFGSMDNDPPAAMRYTEARLAKIAQEMLVDIEKDTVDFTPNFDDSLKEPLVLPARVPNLLMNGSAGIAVGMATNIPPHNLGELCDAICHLIDHSDATIEDLVKFVPGPDFPTAGIILGKEGIVNAYATGHGRIIVRAKATPVEVAGGRTHIIVSELPYQTDKSALIEKIAQLVKDKRIEGISELRDESDRQGMRIVIELRRDAHPQMIINSLFKHTQMQTAFFFNMLALVDGQPRVISLKEALQHFIDFRNEVITRRSRFELKQAKARQHILEGLKIALDNIDRIIKTIRESKSAETARAELMKTFELSQIQAQAILDMQLRRLANLERQKILDEYTEVSKNIAYLEDLLANPHKILELIKSDTKEIKKSYGDPRRTVISEQAVLEFREEDLIPHERVVVTLSNRGFIKRVPARAYRIQHRGGKGITGMVTREADAVRLLTIADTHDTLLFFTNFGKVYSLKCHELPSDSSRTAKGTAVVNLFPVAEREKVTAMLNFTAFVPGNFCLMATRRGEIKKTAAQNFAAVRSNGLIAMDLEENDELIDVALATEQDEIIIVTQKGQSIRFSVKELRTSSRTSGGVRGIRLESGDQVVSMDTAVADAFILVISTNGHGKLTPVEDYPLQHRGGKGVQTLRLTDKTGDVAAARLVTRNQTLMLISAEGIVTATPIKEKRSDQGIPIYHRTTQGVRIMRLEAGDRVSAVTNFDNAEDK